MFYFIKLKNKINWKMKINLFKSILFTMVISLVFTLEKRVDNASPIKNLKKNYLNENVTII